ncbi:translation initiation factor IF-2-like [Moschus berezovskii]|uniref:translation initiation factor IF-2-like n=1 Tax=Moschus berezovskii TaxID=68408 RepID=UPI0024453642|nr:translation initiation factor IF-2-like [Moschus berezovskii]
MSPSGFREAGRGGPGWAAPPERLVSAGAGGDREETDLSPPPRAVRVPSPQRSPTEVGETPAGSWAALGSPTPMPVGPHPPPRPPGHTWAPPWVPGLGLCRASTGEGRPTQKREGATRARASLPRNRPRLGHRPRAAAAQLLLPPSPTPSGAALAAAVLRRPQAETGTSDGCLAGESPRARQRTTPVRPPRVGRGRRASGLRVGPAARPSHATSVGCTS